MSSDSAPDQAIRADGRLSDGRAALSVPAVVEFSAGGLVIETEDGTRRAWPLGDLRSFAPLSGNLDDALITSVTDKGTSVLVADRALLAALAKAAPHLRASGQRWRAAGPGLALAAGVAALVAMLWVNNASPVAMLAHQLPQSMRVKLGVNTLKTFIGNTRTCATGAGDAALAALTSRLTAALPEAKDVRISVVDWHVVNAFTAPGGQIIVARGLIAKAEGPDEVAGVIAHEIGHAVELHPEAGVIRALGLKAASELMLAGSASAIGNAGILLAQMSYTRDAEREADRRAFQMLKAAGLSPKGIAAFFRRVAREDSEKSATKAPGSSIFASHPSSLERAALADAQADYPTTSALDEEQWYALSTICGAPPATKPRAPQPPPATAAAPLPAPTPTPPASPAPKDAGRTAGPWPTVPSRPTPTKSNFELRTRGEARLARGEIDGALVDLQKALEIDPTDDLARTAMSRALVKRGSAALGRKESAKAIADFNWAIKFAVHGDDIGAAFAKRGAAMAAKGDVRQAGADFKKAVEYAPKNAEIARAREAFLRSLVVDGSGAMGASAPTAPPARPRPKPSATSSSAPRPISE